MVRAILDGRKTQTRRVVKRIAGIGEVTEFQRSDTTGYDWIFRDKRSLWNDLTNSELVDRCPCGYVGQRLWVRETWATDGVYDDTRPSLLDEFVEPFYRASGESAGRWRLSIHMPRWASRITLEITNVRVERVQYISEADAIAEGVDPGCYNCGEPQLPSGCGCQKPKPLPVDAFIYLWDSINAKRGYSWESNPWVFVVEFRRL
jgi:hypothetical protein